MHYDCEADSDDLEELGIGACPTCDQLGDKGGTCGGCGSNSGMYYT